ncbi:MAG: ketopantoate reductase family protein [Burkholderiaceae bacterium]
MKILIVGAGATGGYFGARLAQAGRDVTFLVRPKRAESLRANGLRVRAAGGGEIVVRPKVVTAAELREPFELVLLTVKAFGLEGAIADIAPAVGPGTLILPVLNGVRHVDTLRERFGDGAVLGGVARVSTRLDEDGAIVQMLPVHELLFGALDGGRPERVLRVHAALAGAGFDATLSERILQELWNKWLMLASLGTICCLARATIGEVEAVAGGAQFARAVIDEVAAVAVACGHPPSTQVVDGTRVLLTTPGSGLTSSMYRDLVAGEAVEAEQILGDLRRRAQGAGVAVPLVDAACVQLAAYERRRAG